MSDKTKELLAVLDMSKEDQSLWLIYHEGIEPTESLADLAFRLRDEAVRINQWIYSEVIRDICRKTNSPKADNCSCFDAAMWAEIEAQPIVWIIAALIAKELSKDND